MPQGARRSLGWGAWLPWGQRVGLQLRATPCGAARAPPSGQLLSSRHPRASRPGCPEPCAWALGPAGRSLLPPVRPPRPPLTPTSRLRCPLRSGRPAALARATRTASGPRKSWGARRRPSQRASPPGPRSLTRLPGDPCPAGSARGPGAPEGPGPRPPVQLDPQVPRRTGDSRAECVVAGLARRVRAGGSERCLCLGNRIAGADGASAVSVSDRTCPVCEQGSGHCSEATGVCSHRPWDPSLLSPPRSASTLLFYFFLVSDFF